MFMMLRSNMKLPSRGSNLRFRFITEIVLVVVFMVTMAAGGALDRGRPTRKVHFMIEFIPWHSSRASRKEKDCGQEEIRIIQDFVSNVIHEDTGFSHAPHRELYLDGHYNAGRHPGFDVTYECPPTCEGFSTDWCDMLCEQDLIRMGHDPLDAVAKDLKDRIHHTSKGHDAMFAVTCLGDITKVDLHLVVGTSPYIVKPSFVDRRSSRSAL